MFWKSYSLVTGILALIASVDAKETSEKQLEIALEGSWNTTPFILNLLESVSANNESLYSQALSNIIENDDNERPTDSFYYDLIANELNDKDLSFFNFDLVNKINSPRIQAHYDYYNSTVRPEFLARVQRECATDSFGNPVLSPEEEPKAWLLYNDKIYCSPDEVFALQTNGVGLSRDSLLPFDRVVGENEKAPLLVLYGDIESKFFKDFLRNVYYAAESGKIQFVWRYIESANHKRTPEQLTGYGVDLTLKRTDYIVIDDRDDKKDSTQKVLSSNDDIKPINKDQISQLGLKLTSHVLQQSDESQYEALLDILQDFPQRVSEIANLNIDIKNVQKNMLANEKLGISEDSIGLYVNGSPLNRLELDLFTLVDKIQNELELIENMKSLGFTNEQAKKLISKFALMSAVKQAHFYKGNSMMGGKNDNRFKVYQHEFQPNLPDGMQSGGVVFFNDLALDVSYNEYSTNGKLSYSDSELAKLRAGQIPKLRENVHDLIFAIDISNRDQLKVFFTISKLILDRSIPQQIGVLPMKSTNVQEELLIKIFYFITDTASAKEALAFLYKYLESKSSDETDELLKSIEIPSDYIYGLYNEATLETFSISQPSVIFNGVINELTAQGWQSAMGKQISHDVRIINFHVKQSTYMDTPLKSLIYENAQSSRNLKIIPTDPSAMKFKPISEELINNSYHFECDRFPFSKTPMNFWIIGDFNMEKVKLQFLEILNLMDQSPGGMQLRLVHTGQESALLAKILRTFNTHSMTDSDVKFITKLSTPFKAPESDGHNITTMELLERNRLPSSHSYLLLNSRYIRITDSLITKSELKRLVDFEATQRIEILDDLVSTYPKTFAYKTLLNFKNGGNLSDNDWFDLLCSTVTKSFFVDNTLFLNDVSRFDFESLNKENSLSVSSTTSNDENEVDVLVILDPVDEFAQKVVSMLNSIKEFTFVNIKILLQPQLLSSEEFNVKRFYRGVYPDSKPKFNSRGFLQTSNVANFTTLPQDTLLTADLETPMKWIPIIKDTPIGVDADNIQLTKYDLGPTRGTYELKSILIEGFARETKSGLSPDGLALEVRNTAGKVSDTNVMSSLGYFQLQSNPGLWKLRLKDETTSSAYYSLLSANDNSFSINTEPREDITIPILSLKSSPVNLRVSKKTGYEDKSLFEDLEAPNSGGLMKKMFKKKNLNKKQADINIFSIVSGHLYERFLSIMTASVRKNTNQTVKFWIIENFVSSHFKKLLPYLAQKYDFEYELITYKWPNWLRQQREKQRTIWGYKILFLDVIFPQDLEKVIFVDADQIVRTDLQELVDENLNGCVYGFTPMCDSRDEMEGFRFWKRGYWEKVLGDEYKYHISALYVVDLVQFRKEQAGNRIRSSYQKLSSDPLSLANLDQDLPNNLQRQIPIHSLSQDWLWCETWCSDEGLKSARTIDLCNNPLTKEPKLERAKRQIPEWTTYDDEVTALVNEMREIERQELQEKVIDVDEYNVENIEDGQDYNGESEDDDYYHDEL
ncbi:killer toxin-resistance protein 5 [[Candida] anglica]|uniref:Killer toxin-resistance protein 5 n=1 Tax=[Candida] anglica TaxID=148631 RepID=A0ABP0EFZ4_9ASCO